MWTHVLKETDLASSQVLHLLCQKGLWEEGSAVSKVLSEGAGASCCTGTEALWGMLSWISANSYTKSLPLLCHTPV